MSNTNSLPCLNLSPDCEPNPEVVALQEQVAALEQLLEVYEQESLEKADRLEQAMAALQEHSHQLAQSEARYRKLAQQKELLNQLVGQIRQSLNLETILETAVAAIQELLQIDTCLFWWYYPEFDSFQPVCEAHSPNVPAYLSQRRVSNQNQSSFRFNLSGTQSNTPTPEGWSANALPLPATSQINAAFGDQVQLILPTQTRSGRLGTIHCLHQQAQRDWTDDEVDLLREVASQLAIALDQAELYEQSCAATAQAQAQAQELERALHEIQQTPKLIQTEKMASLGQLVAGVAHEINNPVNFIHGNLTYASEYSQNLLELLALYQQEYPTPSIAIQTKAEDSELEFIQEDLPKLFTSMKIGADRIRTIVQSLRTFSRLDEAEVKAVDIHEGIESTLMILQNRLKPKFDRPAIQVDKQYGQLPAVDCYAGQLNQVFMNILSNAIDALEEVCAQQIHTPMIQIRTELRTADTVAIHFLDNGPGIKPEVQQRLFDPFFTTKSVGKGTGLGMSISYQIITETHHGQLLCHSAPGAGAEFVIEIPVKQRQVQEPLLKQTVQA